MARKPSASSFNTRDDFPVFVSHGSNTTADIVVIGGGATGVGVACDAALRGFSVILIEKDELGTGTSGRFHGMLHSGARYAVDDPETAAVCMRENLILRQIAAPAIKSTGGLFLALSDEEVVFSEQLIGACHTTDIPIEELSLHEAIKREPNLVRTPKLRRALAVPDGSIDGKKLLELCRTAAESASTPARFLEHHELIRLKQDSGRITTVIAKDSRGNELTIDCGFVVNAAGVWANRTSKLADITIDLLWDKGSMVVLEDCLTNEVINRCRSQRDGDILVPLGGHSIIGTTSIRTENIDSPQVEQWEIETLLREGRELIPNLSSAEIRMVYAGVRPLVGSGVLDSQGRKASRCFRVIDHADEGVANFISVVGGKFTIYRKMAEVAVDLICKKEKSTRTSKTHEFELIGAN